MLKLNMVQKALSATSRILRMTKLILFAILMIEAFYPVL